MPLTRIALDEFPEKCLILLEEEAGDIKRIVAQMIASDALSKGKKVVYITPRMKTDIQQEISGLVKDSPDNLEVIERTRDPAKLADLCKGEVCVIENFPLFFVDAVDRELLNVVNELVHSCRDGGRIILLTADRGILSERQQKIVRSLSDGVIELTTVLIENRINRYLLIHKLKGSAPLSTMVPYSVDSSGTKVYIDTRERYA